jgi:hypothetical protein
MGAELWLSLWLAAPAPALASEGTWAEIPAQIDDCVDARGIDREQLAYLVGNELEGPAAGVAERLREQGARFVLGCSDDGVSARLEGPTPVRTQVRTQGFECVVATRTIALAIVEMVTELPEPAVSLEPEPAPEPTPAPTPEPAPPSPTPTLRRPAPTRWVLRAGFDALGFPLAPLGLFGAALDARQRPRRHLGWLAAVAVDGGRDRERLGTVRAFTASGTLAAVVHGDRDRIDPYAAVGLRGGVAALRGVAAGDGVLVGRVRGGWLGPLLRGGIDVFVGRRVVVGAQLELGWAVLGTQARVDGRPGAGATQLWLGGGVAVGWRVRGPSS